MNSIGALAALSGLILMSTSGVDRDQSARILRAQGLKQVILGENSRKGCGELETHGTRFAGLNHEGRLMTGVVCGKTWVDGITVYLD